MENCAKRLHVFPNVPQEAEALLVEALASLNQWGLLGNFLFLNLGALLSGSPTELVVSHKGAKTLFPYVMSVLCQPALFHIIFF